MVSYKCIVSCFLNSTGSATVYEGRIHRHLSTFTRGRSSRSHCYRQSDLLFYADGNWGVGRM